MRFYYLNNFINFFLQDTYMKFIERQINCLNLILKNNLQRCFSWFVIFWPLWDSHCWIQSPIVSCASMIVIKKSNWNYRVHRTKLLDFVTLQEGESFFDRESRRLPVWLCLSLKHFQTCLPDFFRSFLALLSSSSLFGLMAALGKLFFVSRKKSGLYNNRFGKLSRLISDRQADSVW